MTTDDPILKALKLNQDALGEVRQQLTNLLSLVDSMNKDMKRLADSSERNRCNAVTNGQTEAVQ